MKIKAFETNIIGENCYVVSDDKYGCIIDCGAFNESTWNQIKQYIETEKIELIYALQTHAHFDHVYGLGFVKRDYGIAPMMHSMELSVYNNVPVMANGFGLPQPTLPLPAVEKYFNDGDTISLGELKIEVIHTPGHTPGGVCFYIESEGVLFSGDTLFQGSIGRTDFPGGSQRMEIESIRERLFTLPDSTTVYPGHGIKTTIKYEKQYNLYI